MSVELTDDDVRELARLATGRLDGEVAGWQVAAAPHPVENLTTERLDRLTGTLTDGTPWSVFAKTLRPASNSPAWEMIPEEHHRQVLEDLNWLDEPRVYRSGLAEGMPPGLRLPTVFRIDESDARITLWLEDVDDHGAWDLGRYRQAAELLGRLGGRWPESSASSELAMSRRHLARLFFGKITHYDLPIQADDTFWLDPAVAAAVDSEHRADLQRLAADVPGLLGRLETLPHGMAHGDATPDNFRDPGDGTLVALDWSYGSCAALGSDLGQLLAGRYESGAADPEDLGAIAAAILAGYVDGLRAEGVAADPAQVEEAFAAYLAVRSVFSLLVIETGSDVDEAARRDLLVRRAALGRFGIDLAARVLTRHG